MMSLLRNLAVVFLLTALSLIHSHIFTHAASTSSPVTHRRIIFLTGVDTNDDYDEEDFPFEVTAKTTLLHREIKLCQYDPCRENQEPCAQLSARTGCLCPGLSESDEPPHPPRIHVLLPIHEGNDTGKVEVQWCAPSSVVSGYRVVVEGRNGDQYEFGDASRRGVMDSLEVGTKVCVEALNNAGRSAPSEFSCRRYDPSKSSDHEYLAWFIGVGVTVLVLLIIGCVIFWKNKICIKGKRNSTDGLGNPS